MKMPMKMPALPAPLFFVEIDGRVVFPLFGASGGLAQSLAVYVMETPPAGAAQGYDLGRAGLHEEDGGRWYCVEVSCYEPEDLYGAVAEAVKVLGR